MTTLLPCPECRRHVRSEAATCPFCATGVKGRLARAVAVVLAGALVGTAACGGTQAKPQEESNLIQNQPGDAGPVELVEEEEPDAAVPVPEDKRRIRQRMPYGAPPTRDRLV